MTTANKITIFRILLVPFFIVQVLYYLDTGRDTTVGSPFSRLPSRPFATASMVMSRGVTIKGASWAQFWIRLQTNCFSFPGSFC